MSDKERIVCDMLRELAPERDWLYLGEVEHARIGEMVDAVTDDLKAENAKLRELIFDMLVDEERGHNDDYTYYEHVRLAKELGIEVE